MEYFNHLAILFGIFATLGISLNLVVGYTGLPSVTHAAFYGFGAYTVALATTRLDINFLGAAGMGILVAAGIALLTGVIFSRFKDDYYVLSTAGFNVIAFSILLNWQSVTRGPLGIPAIPRPALGSFSFTNSADFFLLVMFALSITILCAHLLTSSSFGRALKAIREDEQALQVFGYRTHHYKLVIFVLSAGMAGMAGGLYAAYISFISPTPFTVHESIFMLSIIILGGLASLRGSLLGALVLILLPELLRFVGFPSDIAGQMRQVIYGVLLILLMLYRPQGLVGEYKL